MTNCFSVQCQDIPVQKSTYESLLSKRGVLAFNCLFASKMLEITLAFLWDETLHTRTCLVSVLGNFALAHGTI